MQLANLTFFKVTFEKSLHLCLIHWIGQRIPSWGTAFEYLHIILMQNAFFVHWEDPQKTSTKLKRKKIKHQEISRFRRKLSITNGSENLHDFVMQS